MRNLSRLGFFIFILAFTSSQALAARIAIVGAANSSEPKEAGITYKGATAYGLGLLMEYRVVPALGFEIGALYLPRKYSYSTAIPQSTTVTIESKMYQFPLLMRLHMGRSLSFGIGGYYSMATGKISEATNADTGASFRSVGYGEINQTTSDYGLASSIVLYFWVAPLMHFVVDGRYMMGLKDNHTGGGNRKFNDMQLLAGLQFGF